MGPLLALAIATADRLDPDHVGAPRRVAKAVVAAVAAKCHDSRMLDGDHYQAATWALGSCGLDVVGLMVSAWQEGHFCAGTGPSCPRGDHGHSAGTFQVQGWADSQWSADLTDLYERDLGAAAVAAYAVVIEGARRCPEEPLALYCGGSCSPIARILGHARLEAARDLMADILETAP